MLLDWRRETKLAVSVAESVFLVRAFLPPMLLFTFRLFDGGHFKLSQTDEGCSPKVMQW